MQMKVLTSLPQGPNSNRAAAVNHTFGMLNSFDKRREVDKSRYATSRKKHQIILSGDYDETHTTDSPVSRQVNKLKAVSSRRKFNLNADDITRHSMTTSMMQKRKKQSEKKAINQIVSTQASVGNHKSPYSSNVFATAHARRNNYIGALSLPDSTLKLDEPETNLFQ